MRAFLDRLVGFIREHPFATAMLMLGAAMLGCCGVCGAFVGWW